MKKEKALKKLKNLIERTQHNGCSEAEALQAAMKVGELMEKYNVSMDEIQFANEEFRKLEIKLRSKRTNYMRDVINAISYFTDTKCWMGWYREEETYKRYRCYNFFGAENDVMVAEYIYHVIENAIKLEFEKFKKSDEYKNSPYHGKTKSTSFFDGINSRISRRLEDMKDEMRDEQREEEKRQEESIGENSEESSLIVYDKFEIVEKKFKEKLDIKLKTSYSYRRKQDSDAYGNGVSAGDNVNIRKAVTGAKTNGQKRIE